MSDLSYNDMLLLSSSLLVMLLMRNMDSDDSDNTESDSDNSDEDEEGNHNNMDESPQVSSTVSRNTVPAVRRVVPQVTNQTRANTTAQKANTTQKVPKQGLNVSNSNVEPQQSALKTKQTMPQGTNLTRTNTAAQKANMTQKVPQQRLNISNSNVGPQQSALKIKQTTTQGANMTTSKPVPHQGLNTYGCNFPTSRQAPQVSSLTIQNVAAHNAKFPHRMPLNCGNRGTFFLAPNIRPSSVSAMNPSARYINPRAQNVAATGVGPPIHGHFGQWPTMPEPSTASKAYGAAGTSKRPGSDPDDGGKKKKGKPAKKMKIDETERDVPEHCLENPFEMIDIEEPIIKEEMFEPEEFDEMKNDDILPNDGSIQEKSHFETVYCTPGIIKEERQDDVEAPSGYDAAETDTTVPEFMRTVIKSEPLEEEQEDDDDEEEEGETKPRDSAPLMWRCPLVSCPEMFGAELEMYQHLNLNHVVKGLALSSKSKKVSAPRPVTTSPSVAIPGTSGLVFLTSSSPRVSPVTVPTSQTVPTSSCGSVTVTTTTFSYSSTTSSCPLVTTVSSSSVSCATLIPSASPSVTSVPSGSIACPLLPNSTPDVSVFPSVSATNLNSLTCQSPNPLPVTTASQGLQKFIVAPISDLDSSSTRPTKFLLLAPQQSQQPQQMQQLQQKSATKTSNAQPVQIFHPSGLSIENLPPCATDDSEMFSISLAQFPQNRRVPIKRKLIDVVDCIKQKNISPDKLLIAFSENSFDSRTM